MRFFKGGNLKKWTLQPRMNVGQPGPRFWIVGDSEYTTDLSEASTFADRAEVDRWLTTHAHMREFLKPIETEIPETEGLK